MRWLFLAATIASAAPSPSKASSERLLVVTDPNANTEAATLLELAVIEEIERDPEVTVVVPREQTPKQARAANWIADAARLLKSAHTQFDQLDLDVALRQFSRATKLLDKAMPHVGDIRPLLDSLTMLAATHLFLGQDRKARSALQRLLVLDIDTAPNESVFNPQMMAVFASVVTAVRSGKTTGVEVTVDPPAAAVFFDGRLVGRSPVTVEGVHEGSHYLTAVSSGFETGGRAIEVEPRSGPHEVSFKLSEANRSELLETQASKAIAAMDDASLSDEAQKLLETFRADRVVLLAATGSEARLVAYDADGNGRLASRVTGSADDLSRARSLARSLVAGAFKPTNRTTTEEEEGASPRMLASTQVPSAEVTSPRAALVFPWSPLFSRNRTKEIALYAAYGGGLLLGTVAGIFGSLSLAAHSKYYMTGPFGNQAANTDQIEGQDISAAGRRNALIADVLYGAMGAALLAGLLLHLLWEPADTPDPRSAPSHDPTGIPTAASTYTLGPGFLGLEF